MTQGYQIQRVKQPVRWERLETARGYSAPLPKRDKPIRPRDGEGQVHRREKDVKFRQPPSRGPKKARETPAGLCRKGKKNSGTPKPC